MADSIKANGGAFPGSTNDSYVEKQSLGFTSSDLIYVGFQIYLKASDLTAWAAASAYGPFFLQIYKSTGGYINGDYVYDSNADNVYDEFYDDYHGGVAATPTGDAWHKFEWSLDPANGYGPLNIYVDGVLVATDAFGPGDPFSNRPDRLRLGALRNGSGQPNGDIYFGEIRAGTAYDAFDKFQFIPALAADLSPFTVVHNNATLDTAPTPPPAWSAPPPTAPVFVSAYVLDDQVTGVMDQPLQVSPGPDPSEFTFTADGFNVPVVSASVDGSNFILGLATPVGADAVPRVTYTAP